MTPHKPNPETPIMSDKSDNISDKPLHGSGLAARVEALTRPDRGIDAEIHWLVLNGVGTGYGFNAPAYTRSLDAAMTLVGQHGAKVSIYEGGKGGATCWTLYGNPCHVNAATPALALCAAALRARSA